MSNEINSVGNWDITIGGVPVVEFTANVGAIGPQGNDGVAVANAPITYDVMTRTIGLDPTYVPNALVPYATLTSVDTKIGTAIGNLVNSAPSTLDTLQEIATALGNDPNLATTLTNLIATKSPIASPTFTGDPKAPTPLTADNDTSIATTAFVKAQGYLTTEGVNQTIGDYLGTGIEFGSGNTHYEYGNNGLESFETQGSENLHTTKYQLTGISSFDVLGEDAFSLSKNGISGKALDDLHFALNGSGLSFGDQSNTYTFNSDGITGDGWSISTTNGITGLPFNGISVSNTEDLPYEENGENFFENITASLNVSASNGISLKWESEQNNFFGSSEIKIRDGVNNFSGRTSFGSTSPRGYYGSLVEITDNSIYQPLVITQLGTGHAFVVNDSTSDATPFIIDKDGHVGIGVYPSSTICLSVDATGIKYGSNTTAQTVPYIPSAVAITGGTITGATITLNSGSTASTPATSDNDTSIATTAFVKAQNYITSSALTPYLLSATASTTYYPLGSNPSGYLTSANLTGYAPLASPTFTGDVYISRIRNPLNTNFVINAYNDTGAGTNNYFNFNPYGGGFELPTNSSGIKFGDGSTQSSAFVPANYYASNNPAGYITSSALTPYAELAGATFTGKVIGDRSTTASGFNIKTGVTPATTVAGDVWIGSTGIRYADGNNVNRLVADTNRANTFTTNQIFQSTDTNNSVVTVTANGNGGGLKITNLGTGESLRVEDETSPDATAFVVSNNGRVGIGVAPDATVALTVDATGIKVNGATLIPASAVTNSPFTSGNMSHSEYPKELVITINGVNYAIPLRVI